MHDDRILRIADANANRTREALRVAEDVLRFWLENGALARKLKRERHAVSGLCDDLVGRGRVGLAARNVAADPGKHSKPRSETRRRDVGEILVSNFRRAEEGLRVLEEIAKLVDAGASHRFKKSRFRVYQLEKSCTAALEREIAER
ncbi:MAG: thiamine-phosphate pyrophosphorylase [bacterium]